MMDLTASEHDLRCDRIRDLIVAQQPATITRAERSALTRVTPWSTKPHQSQSDRCMVIAT
jgi:hypothetical protein